MHAVHHARPRGFSLLELMLVVVIILLASVVAIPSFVKSHKGAKLRSSARTVVMASRFARSTAVLQQKQTAILFDLVKHDIEIVSISESPGADDRSMFLEARQERTGSDDVEDADSGAGASPSGGVVSEMIRSMAEDVTIAGFESEAAAEAIDGIHWVNYFRNGMCDDFRVRLVDDRGKSAEIKVDALSGKVAVEYE